MSLNNPLIVPVDVHAFAVNQNTLGNIGANIQRWQYSYPFLENFDSPMPKPFTGQNSFPGTGVAVHWTLPAVLRRGRQDEAGGMRFPLVPNRWMVVRYSGPPAARSAVAWVVESDALGNADPLTGGSPYIQPNAATLKPTFVGQVAGLSGWAEPDPPELFLTAVAPGNNMFASFQPYNQGVFSMFDPLTGVAAQDTLSYMVAGWYSAPGKDILATWKVQGGGFESFLEQSGWAVAGSGGDEATIGLYSGFAWGVAWDRDGPAQNSAPPAGQVQLAIGNTAVDALTALIAAQSKDEPDIDPELLEALQYSLLPAYDQPDAQFLLQQQIVQGWFGARSGGYRWEIVAAPVEAASGDSPQPPSADELATEATWLAELNVQQQALDQAVLALGDLQWDLYQTWWKSGFVAANGLSPYPEGTSQAQFEQALDASDPTSLISKVNAQQETVASLQAAIPFGATQPELQEAIHRYAADKGLPQSRELKQSALRPYHRAYDPTLLMSGLEATELLAPSKPRLCRFAGQIVTGFEFSGGKILLPQVAAAVPTPPNLAAVPAQIANLLQEFFLLDPTNAPAIAQAALGRSDPQTVAAIAAGQANVAGYVGSAPDFSLLAWQQPWSPLVLLWDIVWYPIPHDNGEAPLWSFDGDDYVWNGSGLGGDPPSWEYQGMIFLTPQAGFNFRAQIEKFIAENPGLPEVEKLYAFVEQIDSWDFLSQSLVGLTQRMALRDPAPNLSPTANSQSYFSGRSFASLVGSSATYVPQPGIPQPQPFQPWPPSGFQNWRAGQFLIRRLFVVDRFGQSCEVVTSQTQTGFAPILAPSLKPQHPVLQQGGDRFIQLPPRLLQSARLNFDYVSCADDAHVLGLNPGVNPVCGWLLHNYLDESIVAYDNTGAALGWMWIITDRHSEGIVHWQPAPNSVFQTLEDLLKVPYLAHLGSLLEGVRRLGPSAFKALLATVDEAVWSIESGDTTTDLGLTLLAGRPIALLRVRLMFELAGTPLTDPSWRFTFSPSPNPATGWSFAIRLGESGDARDGLVGYCAGSRYDILYAPDPPDRNPDPGYVVPVGTGAGLTLPLDGSTAAYLTLLADPRAVIHATTGILPPVTIAIPQQFVDPALASMEIGFAIGPLLSDLVTPEDAVLAGPPSLVLPRPTLRTGTWSWLQFDGSHWARFGVSQSVPTAQMSNVNPVIREGILHLSEPLGPSASNTHAHTHRAPKEKRLP